MQDDLKINIEDIYSRQNHKKILQQVQSGILVCPITKEKLIILPSGKLINEKGDRTYHFLNETVPLLVADEASIEEYAKSSKKMNEEYLAHHLRKRQKWINRVRRYDYRTKSSIQAYQAIFDGVKDDAVCISIGGGPTRADGRLLNLNIGPFPNVDIVADAHCLPYADASVDAIHCEAVFEHLHSPTVAAKEIFRVLKSNGRAFICTPFLQAYHGYPHHYQNFTLTGHINLFERVGLEILNSGTCVGPTYALRSLISTYLGKYPPFPINKIMQIVWTAFSLVIAPLDILLGTRGSSHMLASTTYLLATKPNGSRKTNG